MIEEPKIGDWVTHTMLPNGPNMKLVSKSAGVYRCRYVVNEKFEFAEFYKVEIRLLTDDEVFMKQVYDKHYTGNGSNGTNDN